jgi:hypothetical protein
MIEEAVERVTTGAQSRRISSRARRERIIRRSATT